MKSEVYIMIPVKSRTRKKPKYSYLGYNLESDRVRVQFDCPACEQMIERAWLASDRHAIIKPRKMAVRLAKEEMGRKKFRCQCGQKLKWEG